MEILARKQSLSQGKTRLLDGKLAVSSAELLREVHKEGSVLQELTVSCSLSFPIMCTRSHPELK